MLKWAAMSPELAPDPRSFTVPEPTAAPPPILPGPVVPGPTPPVLPPEPPPETAVRPNRWRRRLAVVGLVLALLSVLELGYLYTVWRQVERVDLEGSLTSEPNGGVNFLIVGSDSREGVDADDPNAGAILGGGLGSERTDTILVLRTHTEGVTTMAIPRDLFVTNVDTGSEGRINAAIQGGPASLVRTVEASLGIPIHHFVAVDFVGFGSIVDANGGVTIDFPHPAYDTNSGLSVPGAGPQTLNGTQALAYVRSRHYTEQIDGQDVPDPTSDFGRVARQQLFLRTLMADIQGTRNPLTFNRVAAGMSDALTVDDQLNVLDVMKLARRMAGTEPESLVLPTYGFVTSGGAQVLGLADGADGVLDRFR
ncbi:MAG: LCP family protein [Acidimicrobiia bacterium]|nr:LCP family protein [Acidimicrobiia bacterium]